MRRKLYILGALVVVALPASQAVAQQLAPVGDEEAKGYDAEIRDGKLHCFNTGKKCISWG